MYTVTLSTSIKFKGLYYKPGEVLEKLTKEEFEELSNNNLIFDFKEDKPKRQTKEKSEKED